MQIAHLLMQLLIKGSLMRRCFPGGDGVCEKRGFQAAGGLEKCAHAEGSVALDNSMAFADQVLP
jgi:hypothetical protein